MPIKLAMVACLGPHEGPWAIARGSEAEIRICGLGEEEHVVLDCELSDSEKSQSFYNRGGVFPFPDGIKRYRFLKSVGKIKTTVEIVHK